MQCLNTKNFSCAVLIALASTRLMAQSPSSEIKPASSATLAAQAQMRASLPPDDGQDENFVHRGFIATAKDPLIRAEDGHVVWNIAQFDWIKGAAPPTVNPSLWRQMKLLGQYGLFKIADNVWQVRGFDASNMMIVKGNTGWIVIDPLFTLETASAAIALVNEQLGQRPVTAVIYTHSHADHFGGVRAVVDPAAIPPIVAPEHLVEETVSEHIIAGNAMGRRAALMFGMALKPGPQGYMGSGLTAGVHNRGTVSLIMPNDYIKQTGETRMLDGVKFEFQMVPETEAPSEMNFYLPEQRVFYVSEIATCSMHNVQTPRGALVRDTLKWAGYLTEALSLYGDRSDTLATGHCWPRFGNDVIKNYLSLQRDNYKFIHDQTVRLTNRGETPTEIAEEIKLPAAVANEWSNRGYYGTVRHNAKGVYQRYIGWWDGIPAHLNLHPPVEQGKRYVKAMGGAQHIISEAKNAMAKGDYRWSAEILNHVVFADSENRKAKELLADSYEQMGYQAESSVWRNIYLAGAAELRGGVTTIMGLESVDLVAAMPTSSFLDLLATRLNPDKIGERALTMALNVSDNNEKSLVSVRNAVLVAEVGKSIAAPTVSVSGKRKLMMGLFVKKLPLEKMEAAGLKVDGDRAALLALQNAIEAPPMDYPIVTP
jgi:alkyl sulfatase BDS1-like metallo-beta-lactamase superfamily hydrolase